MSEFEREDQEVISLVRQNRRRSGITETIGYADYEAGNYPTSDAWLYSSFWYKDFDAMAYKTMLRQLISKWGIMSTELQTAFERDTVSEPAPDYTTVPDVALPSAMPEMLPEDNEAAASPENAKEISLDNI